MASLMSVTSSGRSSMSRMIRCMSGWLVVTALATCFKRVVLPAFGGETIMPLCPFPMGESRSITRMAVLMRPPGISRWILSLGKMGVRSSKFGRLSAAPAG